MNHPTAPPARRITTAARPRVAAAPGERGRSTSTRVVNAAPHCATTGYLPARSDPGRVSTGPGPAVTTTVQLRVSMGLALRMSGMEQASEGQTWNTIV